MWCLVDDAVSQGPQLVHEVVWEPIVRHHETVVLEGLNLLGRQHDFTAMNASDFIPTMEGCTTGV